MFGWRRRPEPSPIDWGRVTEVFAIKEDALGPPTISLVFHLGSDGRERFFQPGTPGYREAIRSVHMHLPGITPDWHEQMMGDFHNNYERILYGRT